MEGIHLGCGPRPDSIDWSVLPLPYEAVFSAVQELCAIALAVWESIGNRRQRGLVVYIMDWVSEGQPQLKQFLNSRFMLPPGLDHLTLIIHDSQSVSLDWMPWRKAFHRNTRGKTTMNGRNSRSCH
jgi:hypothetical protein